MEMSEDCRDADAIEITPQMIEAGVGQIEVFDYNSWVGHSPEELEAAVRNIFVAMSLQYRCSEQV